MAAESQQPPDNPIAATATTTTTTPATTATTIAAATAIAPAPPENAGPPLAPKRQRRPSVRLGDIGYQPAATVSYDSHVRRTKQNHHHQPHWRGHKDPSSSSSKSVKARSLTNLVNGNSNSDHNDTQEPEDKNQNETNNNANNLDFGHRKAKAKRGTTKRVRSNWVSKLDEGGDDGDSREDGDEGFRDFDFDSDSPLKDQSPVQSGENAALDLWHGHRRQGPGLARLSESKENEFDYNPPESDSRDRGCGTNEGVMAWLIDLGLSRYAPVFDIHEVDDEVLPMLTLEDLKDMGINAVGSRRKLYSAIQKLRKGFSWKIQYFQNYFLVLVHCRFLENSP